MEELITSSKAEHDGVCLHGNDSASSLERLSLQLPCSTWANRLNHKLLAAGLQADTFMIQRHHLLCIATLACAMLFSVHVQVNDSDSRLRT